MWRAWKAVPIRERTLSKAGKQAPNPETEPKGEIKFPPPGRLKDAGLGNRSTDLYQREGGRREAFIPQLPDTLRPSAVSHAPLPHQLVALRGHSSSLSPKARGRPPPAGFSSSWIPGLFAQAPCSPEPPARPRTASSTQCQSLTLQQGASNKRTFTNFPLRTLADFFNLNPSPQVCIQ